MSKEHDTSETRTSRAGWLSSRRDRSLGRPNLGLVFAWSQSESRRVGEIAMLPEEAGERLLGRGAPRADDPCPRVRFAVERPFEQTPGRPLEGPRISRSQLSIRPAGQELHVQRLGRCPMLINGAPASSGVVRAGDTLMLEDELLLFCCERQARATTEKRTAENVRAATSFAFGKADAHGIVGESPATWTLRDEIAFFAARDGHVLVLGDSGAGKELAARALHRLSRRAGGPFVARNAATLPAGLVDAELFGHARNYPNPGTPERLGLLGSADGGSLFLDEIGELPPELQVHLLRVLDPGGEFHRLGEAQARRVNVRLIAATNRPAESLKHDFLARLTLRVRVPALSEHREDIPLLVNHVLARAAADDEALGQRFFERWPHRDAEPRVDPWLLERLLRHPFTHHVRELESLLFCAMAGSHEGHVALTPEVANRLQIESGSSGSPADLSPERIQAALDEVGGNQERAYRALGLRNRDVLYRLIKKHGLDLRRKPGRADE